MKLVARHLCRQTSWLLLACCACEGQQVSDLTALSLESLLETRVSTASKYEQRQQDVPATINVVTRAEILAYGWRSLSEVLTSLPGFHVTRDRQYDYLGTRGFGLPGDYNTRVLVAINGNRVNDVVYDASMTGREFPLDMELVERIEVLSGPGGAIYGQNDIAAARSQLPLLQPLYRQTEAALCEVLEGTIRAASA